MISDREGPEYDLDQTQSDDIASKFLKKDMLTSRNMKAESGTEK